MKYLKIGVAVAAAAATVAAVTAAVQSPEQKTAGTVAASAANSDSPAAIRASILDGTLWRTHKVVNSCAGPKKYRIGCDFGLLSASGDASKPANTAQPAGLGPDDLARAFHLPADKGKGGTVGIVTMAHHPSLESDLAAYRKQYGLPACTTASGCLKVVGEKGGKPPATTVRLPLLSQLAQSYTLETVMDVEMVSAACPNCKILVVEQPIEPASLAAGAVGFPQLDAQHEVNATNTAIRLGADAVSISYFIGNGHQSNILTQGTLPKGMHHPGVPIVSAAGDLGFLGTAPKDQNWPQQLPFVISAGGVELTSADGGQTFTKKAWGKVEGEKYMSSSSGCSTTLPPANRQPASVSKICGGHRATTDIAAAASGLTIYDTYWPTASADPIGGWGVGVGTSAASPYIAGLFVRAGATEKVSGPNTIYRAPSSAIEDVTSGSNMQNGAEGCKDAPAVLCVSGPGWDGPTGVGVPNGLGAFRPAS
ncbi:hypothetical protein OG417_08260 [Actinoallomurus sp. NBC_01490]|uniref:hypothetical protein n=1 Tax=Actinoallomurus sp. NBC_01490 TaxID=2903557 RepID=UPI002E302CAA|nr:hypothetical protein [Actinoallomurus sp. NBC_01490]